MPLSKPPSSFSTTTIQDSSDCIFKPIQVSAWWCCFHQTKEWAIVSVDLSSIQIKFHSEESQRNKVCHFHFLYRRGGETTKHDKKRQELSNYKVTQQITIYNENQFQSKWIYCNWQTAMERRSYMMKGKTNSIHREIDRMLLIQQFKSNCSNQFSNYNFYSFNLYRSMTSLHIRYQYNLFIRDHPLQWTRKKWSRCLMGSR